MRPRKHEPIVTLKDILTQVTALVGHMQAIDARNTAADEIHRDHEARLRRLEAWRYSLPITLVISGGSAATALAAILQH